jgi:hypothetical protein
LNGSVSVSSSQAIKLHPNLKKVIPLDQFLRESASLGHINRVFDTGMYYLAEDQEKALAIFAAACVPFEIIGGVAVNAHLMEASHRSRSFLTRDIDVLMSRSDLGRSSSQPQNKGTTESGC